MLAGPAGEGAEELRGLLGHAPHGLRAVGLVSRVDPAGLMLGSSSPASSASANLTWSSPPSTRAPATRCRASAAEGRGDDGTSPRSPPGRRVPAPGRRRPTDERQREPQHAPVRAAGDRSGSAVSGRASGSASAYAGAADVQQLARPPARRRGTPTARPAARRTTRPPAASTSACDPPTRPATGRRPRPGRPGWRSRRRRGSRRATAW